MIVSFIRYLIWMLLIIDHFGINTEAHDVKFKRPGRRWNITLPSQLQQPHTGQLVRLQTENKQFMTSGNVEVFTDNRYGIICDNKWDQSGADVVCRQMGFFHGALNFTRDSVFLKGSYTDDDILMDDVKCGKDSKTIQDCKWTYTHNCVATKAAGVICQENTGCPDGWTAGPTGCYLLPENTVTNKEFAVNKCIKHGGHLVNIESELENHFLSHVYSKEIGPILTGGIKKGDTWFWETVTKEEVQDLQETRDRDARHTNQVPMEYTKWFPGWQPGNIFSEPTKEKKERCMYMTSIFRHPNGSDVILDYLFWQADKCTRKRINHGIQYICERKRDLSREEIGCYRGIGSQYRGHAAQTEDGIQCIKWTLDAHINPRTYPNSGLGDHNYCRNPDEDERPWCWTSPGHFQFCDIPVCSDEQVAFSELDDDTEGIECSTDQFQCNDRRCIPEQSVCDMKRDCPDGEDEPNSCHCQDGVTPYNGHIAQTEEGFSCQAWNSNYPHYHKFHEDSMFPYGSVQGAINYCRSPDNDSVPWCFTTDPNKRWGYCSVPKCKDNCVTKASQYIGSTSVTKAGHTCQHWKLDTPNQHGYHEDQLFPDDTVEDASNNCRAPDGDVTPWCYTTTPNIRWEHCSIPSCAGNSADPNVICGRRPLENSRRSRDVKYPESDDSDDDDDDDDADDIGLSIHRKRGKIFGGSLASYGMYPWMVGVREKTSFDTATCHSHLCGGTIINEYWILSAAHCFSNYTAGQIMIRVGDHHLAEEDKYEQEFKVDKLVVHKLYEHYDYDIALVKIKPVGGRGIIFNDYVQPACLPDGTAKFVPGMKFLISGWGVQENGLTSNILKAARVPLVDHTTCNWLYNGTITTNMVCAGYRDGGIDTCAGDSGGPLVCQIDGKYTIMGVTSFGKGCAEPYFPGVYANVVSLLPWIHRQMDIHS